MIFLTDSAPSNEHHHMRLYSWLFARFSILIASGSLLHLRIHAGFELSPFVGEQVRLFQPSPDASPDHRARCMWIAPSQLSSLSYHSHWQYVAQELLARFAPGRDWAFDISEHRRQIRRLGRWIKGNMC